MSTRRFLTLCLTALSAASAVIAQEAGPTLDDILAKCIAARGGLEKIKSLQTVKMTGQATVEGGMQAPMTLVMKRPNMVRLDLPIQGQTVTQAVNAAGGWMVNPFMGGDDPQPLPGEMTSDLRENADFDGPLVNYKERGGKLELLGKEDVGGVSTYKLKHTKKDGRIDTIFIDAKTYLDVKTAGKRTINGQEMDVEGLTSNYKPIDGVPFAHTVEQKANGNTSFLFEVEKIELNTPVEDSFFAMPKKEPPKQ